LPPLEEVHSIVERIESQFDTAPADGSDAVSETASEKSEEPSGHVTIWKVPQEVLQRQSGASEKPRLVLLNTRKPALVAEEKTPEAEKPQAGMNSKGKEHVEGKTLLNSKPLQKDSIRSVDFLGQNGENR